jgi:hypothetical protein
MLDSVKDLYGCRIQAIDGVIGKVEEFYFDDQDWAIRYLVVDTGDWLPGRRVLISPTTVGHPNWSASLLPVGLTTDQVENSPILGRDEPVSRQRRTQLHRYYGWPVDWDGEGEEEGDPHLRSTKEVAGYYIQAKDDEVGHAEDFIVDDETWVIRWIVVDTRNWLPGRKVMVSPEWIQAVDWVERKVQVDLLRETIKNSPEYDQTAPLSRAYEEMLYDYYVGSSKQRS